MGPGMTTPIEEHLYSSNSQVYVENGSGGASLRVSVEHAKV